MIVTDKEGVIDYKGHDFMTLHFRTPATCESCNKPLWHMLHPPVALECRRKFDSVLYFLYVTMSLDTFESSFISIDLWKQILIGPLNAQGLKIC